MGIYQEVSDIRKKAQELPAQNAIGLLEVVVLMLARHIEQIESEISTLNISLGNHDSSPS